MDVVQNILARGGAHLQDVDEDGFTALHHAARYNRAKVMELLLLAGAGEYRDGQDIRTLIQYHNLLPQEAGKVSPLCRLQLSITNELGDTPWIRYSNNQ